MMSSPLLPSTLANEEVDVDLRKKAEPCPKRRRKSLDTHPVEGGHQHDDIEESAKHEAPAVIDSAVDGNGDVGADALGRSETHPGHPEERQTDEEGSGGESTVALNNRLAEQDDQNPDDFEPQSDGVLEADGIEEVDQGGGKMEGTGEDVETITEVSSTEARVAEEKKIVRARSAWMLFLADNRDKVRQENPGLAIGPMQKILSEIWKGLDEAEIARYNKLAEEDKERAKKEMQAAGLSKLPARKSAASVPEAGDATSLVLPMARVRKTVRLDPSVGNISKEGLLATAKATELFMAMMANKAWKIGRQTGRKSVKPSDVADFVFSAPEMFWLRDEFREERSSAKKHKPDGGGKTAVAKKTASVVKGAGSITSFFQKKA